MRMIPTPPAAGGVTRRLAPLVLGLALLMGGMAPAPAQARPPLSQIKEIDNGLLVVALADAVRQSCSSIEPRMLRAYAYLNELKKMARSLGYSDAEIEAHVKSRTEKARMRARGEAYMRAQGLDPAVAEDLCTLGRQEIARGSQIGALLRMR